MESAAAANIHDHKSSSSLQHQILSSSSSSLSPLHNDFVPAGTPHHVWTPNSILSNVSYASDAAILNLRNPRLHNHDNNNLVSSLLNPCMIDKDFGLEWDGNGNGIHHHTSNGHDHELEYSQIKQESLYPAPACYNSNNYAKELREVDELNVKLLLKSLSCGGESSNGGGIQSSLEDCSSFSSPNTAVTSRKQSTCSQIYPTINVSELLGQNVSMGNSGGFGLNLQALDLFNNSARFGASFRPPPFQEHVGFFKNSSCFPYGLDFMQQSIECTMDSGGNVEYHNKRIEESKKHVVNSEPKAGSKTQVGTKRSRLESRACPPFKVRKEKLGDRIAALQQLVSPFGKTDTASVLMEAIGYIKFLQNQIETLSVPYLKSSRHKNHRAAVPHPHPHPHGGYVDNRSEERKQDLKSRGLCLVPVSCLSYVTYGGGAMWPPPPFG